MFDWPGKGERDTDYGSRTSKKLLSVTIVLSLLIVGCELVLEQSDSSDAASTVFTRDGIKYMKEGEYATVIGYEGAPTTITIGLIVIDDEVMPRIITRIKADAFRSCTSLTSISLPPAITKIETDTFYGCENLTEVKSEGYITYIGDGAFCNCTSLKTLQLNSNLDYVGSGAFTRCHINKTIIANEGAHIDINCGANVLIDHKPIENDKSMMIAIVIVLLGTAVSVVLIVKQRRGSHE